MIKEYCLVPKSIADKIMINKEDKDFHIINRFSETSDNNSEDQLNLEELIKKNIPKTKHEKSLSFYNFLRNIPILEYLPNGELIAPIKNINLIEFIKDVVSNVSRKI